MKIMNGRQTRAEDFATFFEVAEIGKAVMPAGVAGVHEADDVQNRTPGQQRRRIVLIEVLLDPVVVVAHTVEREPVDAPDRLHAHPHARRVKVWLEGDDLGV